MIVQRRLDFSRSVRFVGPLLAVLVAYDVAVTVLYMVFHQHWIAVPEIPLPLLGGAITLVVTLRNNAAYNRWWEARTLWGAVVNNSRSIARSALTLTDDAGLRGRLIRSQIAYVIALRCHLLRIPPWEAVARYVPEADRAGLEGVANVPAAIQMRMGAAIGAARAAGRVSEMGATAMDRTLADLANAQGGLERIKNTPLPRQYNHIPKLFTRVFCVLLPIALVKELGYMTPIGSSLIGFMFLALDQIGRNLEDPFEGTNHDIPMLAITRVIEIDLLQTMGETDVPRPVVPERGVLW